MPKINRLDSTIYNRISAGEVVEKPAAVVKELIENSIDAGANDISVSVEGGGVSKIVISDNGCGINRGDLPIAFLPHATSKICSLEDLDSISTLGFRGEALASIASVARVSMRSKTIDNEVGNVIIVNGGKVETIEECGCNDGTVITVKDLFYNTPARAKFLKKPKSEENDISAVMAQLILANPDIAFKYCADGKKIYQSMGTGLENAMYAIYTKDMIDKMIYLDETIAGIRVYGYIGDPQLSKANRSYQTIIVNGRAIKNTTVSTAVATAYGDTLMKRTFPVFVLNLLIPFDDIDVNVHPNKLDVRFKDNNRVFGAVMHSVKNALNENKRVFTMPTVGTIKLNDDIERRNIESSDDIVTAAKEEENTTHWQETVKVIFDDRTIVSEESNGRNANFKEGSTDGGKVKFEDLAAASDLGREQIFQSSFFDKSAINKLKDKSGFSKSRVEDIEQGELLTKAEAIFDDSYKCIGQIFNAFLLVEYCGSLYIMDQHACHERILYDKLSDEIDNSSIKTQVLLLPYIFTVSPSEDSFISRHLKELKAIGVYIEEFGRFSYKVTAIPLILSDMNIENFINELLGDCAKTDSIRFSQLIKDKLAQTACKAAIKAGKELNDEQIKMLLKFMLSSDLPLQCPHGRPAIIKVTRQDVDKLFKRII